MDNTYIRTQASFNGGEISPELQGRVDTAKYPIALKKLINGFCTVQGSVHNRPGLEFVGEVKDSSDYARLLRFAFNKAQQYPLELGNGYARVIYDGGYVVDGSGNPIEIELPYSHEDLSGIKFAQDGDFLSLLSLDYEPTNIVRNGASDWTSEEITFGSAVDAPTITTATWGGGGTINTTYAYKVTAIDADTNEESAPSAEKTVQGIENKLWTDETDGYVDLQWTAIENTVEYRVYKERNGVFAYVGVSNNETFRDTGIKPDFDLTAPIHRNPFDDDGGAETGNYPSVMSHHSNRNIYANTFNQPRLMVFSRTGTEKNLNVSMPLLATDAIHMSVRGTANEVQNIVSQQDLFVLTSDAEFVIEFDSAGLSAAKPPVLKKQSNYGSSPLQPIESGTMILFVQSNLSKIRDLGYSYLTQKYDGDDLTVYANHLFKGKEIVAWDYAQDPYNLVYCVMSDGTLNVLTYEPSQEVTGWQQWNTKGEFESIIRVREGFEDVPYFVIKREINGVVKRYVERLKSRYVEKTEDAFLVDCGLRYNTYSITIGNDLTASASTGTINISTVSNIFASTMTGRIINVVDEQSNILSSAKITSFISATQVTANVEKTFENLNCAGGSWGISTTEVTGLDHLEGEKVIVLADGGVLGQGAVFPDEFPNHIITVENGSITLPIPASNIVVGLPYTFEMETLGIENEDTIGLMKKVISASVKIENSTEYMFSSASGEDENYPVIRSNESINNANILFSKDIELSIGSEMNTSVGVKIEQPFPLPLSILSLTVEVGLNSAA